MITRPADLQQLSFAVLQIGVSNLILELLSQNSGRSLDSTYYIIGSWREDTPGQQLYCVFCVYYNKHLISEQPQLDVACKVFLELVLKIIFLSFYSLDFLSNSK